MRAPFENCASARRRVKFEFHAVDKKQKPVITENVQGWARCAWEKSWLTGDAATRARAASLLADLPNWDLYAKWDTGWAPHIRQMNDQIRTTGDSPILRQDVLANCQGT